MSNATSAAERILHRLSTLTGKLPNEPGFFFEFSYEDGQSVLLRLGDHFTSSQKYIAQILSNPRFNSFVMYAAISRAARDSFPSDPTRILSFATGPDDYIVIEACEREKMTEEEEAEIIRRYKIVPWHLGFLTEVSMPKHPGSYVRLMEKRDVLEFIRTDPGLMAFAADQPGVYQELLMQMAELPSDTITIFYSGLNL